jgi:hypothetical protein
MAGVTADDDGTPALPLREKPRQPLTTSDHITLKVS